MKLIHQDCNKLVTNRYEAEFDTLKQKFLKSYQRAPEGTLETNIAIVELTPQSKH